MTNFLQIVLPISHADTSVYIVISDFSSCILLHTHVMVLSFCYSSTQVDDLLHYSYYTLEVPMAFIISISQILELIESTHFRFNEYLLV